MTDRERFVARAKEMGAKVFEINNTNTIMVISRNGSIVTMYSFTEDGSYKDSCKHIFK